MSLDVELLFRIMLVLLGLDGALLAALLLSKYHYRRLHRRKVRLSAMISGRFFSGRQRSEGGESEVAGAAPPRRESLLTSGLVFRLFRDLSDSIRLPNEMRAQWKEYLQEKGELRRVHRRLNARSALRRLEAASELGVFGGVDADEALLMRLSREQRWFVRLIIIHMLIRHRYVPALPEIMRVLRTAPAWVRQKSFSKLPAFGEELERYISSLDPQANVAEAELLLELGEYYSCRALNRVLLDFLETGDERARRAAAALEKSNPRQLLAERYFTHPDAVIRSAAVRSLRWKPEAGSVERLLDLLEDRDETVRNGAVGALEEIIRQRPGSLDRVVQAFHRSKETSVRGNLVRVLESRLEYFLTRINTERYTTVRRLIEELVRIRRLSVLFGFLERNRSPEITDAVLQIITPLVERDPDAAQLCRAYLSADMLRSLGLQKPEEQGRKAQVPLKRGDRRVLVALLAAILCTGPLVYGLYLWSIGGWSGGLSEVLRGFVYQYNFFFAFYAIAINSIYLLLLISALLHLFRQRRFWRIGAKHLLFSRDLLPSITVLAPAFNEERSIVDNVKSLVNLHYPDAEVIVINDGSGDRTLDRLLTTFEMERVDRQTTAGLETEPVRGVYISRSYPNLTVVDKVNGGKADSLNAGINLASRDFICTIDSDSLLEEDALLKVAFHTVLSDREPVALGGNIIPANGCTVRNGRPVEIALPRDHLSRFQTIEYMRAFLAGRLGWSFINSMVIISGAFGLFIRKRVVEVGGYLTPRSRHRASTVGEDMELVVRLHEYLRRAKIPYKVYDAFNANCWTEVPDRFRVLYRQRDRWHRGLIESILLHKGMAFNPRYGPVGAIAFPYFLIFELIGPFLELFGYLNLILTVALGLISGPVVLLLFIAVILYGILVSLGSLLISENEILYFSVPETMKIILYAFLENFGFRQVMSAIRVTAYVSFIFKEKSWGTMERRGFGGG